MEPKCPVCANQSFRRIGKPKTNSVSNKFIRKDYYIVQCQHCKLYFVSPSIDFIDIEWAELYNNDYFNFQSKWLVKKRGRELSARFSKACELLGAKKNVNFLDIGTGEGKTLLEGLKRGWNITGIDIVDNRIPEAKNESINFYVSKFLDCNLPENHFDFIYLDSVLEHVTNPKEYLYKIHKLLNKNGILYVGVPNEDSLFNDIRKIMFFLLRRNSISTKLKPFDNPYHVVGFNRYSLNYLFSETKLDTRLFRNFGRKFQFLASSPKHKAFWITLFFLLPIEFLGSVLKRDVYFEAYLGRINNNQLK